MRSLSDAVACNYGLSDMKADARIVDLGTERGSLSPALRSRLKLNSSTTGWIYYNIHAPLRMNCDKILYVCD